MGATVAVVVVLSLNFYLKEDKQTVKNDSSKQNQMQVPVHQTYSMPSPQSTDFVQAAEKSLNAVVHIKTEINVQGRFGLPL